MLALVTGRGAAERIAPACAEAGIVVSSARAGGPVAGGCLLLDRAVLERTGAVALWSGPSGWQVEPTRGPGPGRLWTRAGRR